MNGNSNLEFRKIKSLKFLYEINENGTIIRNVKSKKQTKIKLDRHHSEKGYYVAFVHMGGRKNPTVKRVMIHKAVAECWLGDCPTGLEVDHIDRNSLNNDYRNLRYVTKSEQMRNRDHSNIAKKGKENLDAARRSRMKPVLLTSGGAGMRFESFAECARFLSDRYGRSFESFRNRLKEHRKRILDFDVDYLNAETKHDGSTEQEIVHNQQSYDLTGDYKTSFNKGKQAEVADRFRHSEITTDAEYAEKKQEEECITSE